MLPRRYMNNHIQCQWVGALLFEDLTFIRAMLAEYPTLVNAAHEALDDP